MNGRRLPKQCRKGVQKGHGIGRNNRKRRDCRNSAVKGYRKGTKPAETTENVEIEMYPNKWSLFIGFFFQLE